MFKKILAKTSELSSFSCIVIKKNGIAYSETLLLQHHNAVENNFAERRLSIKETLK